ncbi:MAG: tetratricopeptide repeat protein [Armatimonadetes bacterium]|nr:tetratricopeptide repeat protein [Armatimonadota bacterium]
MKEGQEAARRLDFSTAMKTFDRALKAGQKLTGDDRAQQIARARNGYADACLVLGRWDRAQRELKRTIESDLTGVAREEVIRARLSLGQALSRRGEREEAQEHFLEALKTAHEGNLMGLVTKAKIHLGANAGRTGEIDEGKDYLDEAGTLLAKIPEGPEKREIEAFHHTQCGLHMFRLGQNQQATAEFQHALRCLQGMSSLEVAGIRRYMGVMASLKRDYRDALNHHIEALTMFKASGCRYGQAKVYDSIGRTFLALNRMEEAIFSFKKSEALCRRLGANSELATLYGKLGQVYMIREDYETAVKYFRRDLDISSRFRNYYALGYSYRNLGRSLIQVGLMEEAITNLKESLGLFQYVEDSINLGRVYMDLCQAHVKAGRPVEATEAGRKAHSLFKEQNMRSALAFLTSLFGTIARMNGEHQESEKNFKQAIEQLPEEGSAAWRAETFYEMGILYREQSRIDEAVSAFKNALRIAREAGLNRQTGRYLRDLESIDEAELFRAWMEDFPESPGVPQAVD